MSMVNDLKFRREGAIRLAASAAMRRAHLALKRAERLGQGMSLPRLTPAERRARMEIHGNPLRYRPEEPPRNPGDPTPEWAAKMNGTVHAVTVGKGEVAPVKQYRVRHVVEQHGEKFEHSHRSALERFFQDADYAQRVRVASWNASGGGGHGRIGGLGDVPQHVRDGFNRDQWVRAQLPLEMLTTARALVSREILKPDGRPFSLEDFGAQMFPSVQDRNRRWGAAAGAIWALAGCLVHLYQRCPYRARRIDDAERWLEAE